MIRQDDRRARLLAQLDRHRPIDSAEATGLDRLRRFVTASAAPFARSTPEGHVTASAMIVDHAGRILLLFHAALKMWLQPGGHVEEGEEVFAAALREAREESGLVDLDAVLTGAGEPLLLDVDVHEIPASPRKGEPAHAHHDLCFLLRTRQPGAASHDPDESRALIWLEPASPPPAGCDRATLRRIAKVARAAL